MALSRTQIIRIMKIRNIIFAAAVAIAVSCTLDNYDAPDSSLSGRILDADTGDLIECDIYNGTTLHYLEDGYTGLQTAEIKCDGTYHIGNMFAGKYRVVPVHTNFELIDTTIIDVAGPTTYDFEVKPYIRISNVSILKSGGTKVTATFTVTPTSKWNKVAKVALFVHPQSIVGAYMNIDSRELAVSDPNFTSKVFKIVYDFSESKTVSKGDVLYFRVGALCSEPDSRYNYAPAEQVEL